MFVSAKSIPIILMESIKNLCLDMAERGIFRRRTLIWFLPHGEGYQYRFEDGARITWFKNSDLIILGYEQVSVEYNRGEFAWACEVSTDDIEYSKFYISNKTVFLNIKEYLEHHAMSVNKNMSKKGAVIDK